MPDLARAGHWAVSNPLRALVVFVVGVVVLLAIMSLVHLVIFVVKLALFLAVVGAVVWVVLTVAKRVRA